MQNLIEVALNEPWIDVLQTEDLTGSAEPLTGQGGQGT